MHPSKLIASGIRTHHSVLLGRPRDPQLRLEFQCLFVLLVVASLPLQLLSHGFQSSFSNFCSHMIHWRYLKNPTIQKQSCNCTNKRQQPTTNLCYSPAQNLHSTPYLVSSFVWPILSLKIIFYHLINELIRNQVLNNLIIIDLLLVYYKYQ